MRPKIPQPSWNHTILCTAVLSWFRFEISNHKPSVDEQQHPFLTYERVFSRKCQRFWDRKCLDLRGTRIANLRIPAEFSSILSYQRQTFEHRLWRCRYFWSKVNIWYLNCARATAFIFDTRTGVPENMSKFLRHQMSRPEGWLEPSTFGFMPNALTYWAIRARHLLSHVF